jgi:hypothetical protein
MPPAGLPAGLLTGPVSRQTAPGRPPTPCILPPPKPRRAATASPHPQIPPTHAPVTCQSPAATPQSHTALLTTEQFSFPFAASRLRGFA